MGSIHSVSNLVSTSLRRNSVTHRCWKVWVTEFIPLGSRINEYFEGYGKEKTL